MSFRNLVRTRVGRQRRTLWAATPPGTAEAVAGLRHGPGLVMHVVPGDIISDSVLATGVWEADLTRSLLDDAAEGGLLVEVGANLGYFALLWAAAREGNSVLAFEPSPRNVRLALQSIQANRLEQRIDLIPVAAGDALRLSDFELGFESQTGWGGILRDRAEAISLHRVLVVPLDTIIDERTTVTVLKIDVEGADTLVLEGCRRLLSNKQIRKIYYEQNHQRMAAIGVDPDRARALLAEVGYQARMLCPPTDDNVAEWVAEPV